MTLDELKLQVEKDLKIDDERLDTESYKNQELYAKYLDHKQTLTFYFIKQKVITKYCTNKSGNTMVVRLMQKFISLDHLI
tara:strand:- start:45 stop:284 length:240 start_codon:yes stop_codon:yes gene_type:complete